jgi:hypothetical protein
MKKAHFVTNQQELQDQLDVRFDMTVQYPWKFEQKPPLV